MARTFAYTRVSTAGQASANWLTGLLKTIGLAPAPKAAKKDAKPADKKAVKCDLCRGTGGVPACVTACPTGAAARVEPEAYFTWLREGAGQP